MAEEVTMTQLIERIATKEELRALTERVAKVEGATDQMSDRLNHMDTRLNHMDTRLTWIWVTLITMWATITLTILFKG